MHPLEEDACGFKHHVFHNQPFWLRDKAEQIRGVYVWVWVGVYMCGCVHVCV